MAASSGGTTEETAMPVTISGLRPRMLKSAWKRTPSSSAVCLRGVVMRQSATMWAGSVAGCGREETKDRVGVADVECQ